MNKPRVIICRHAESLEDVDNNAYDVLDDLQIPLTKRGMEQARSFGLLLSGLLKDRASVHVYTSPGIRNVQTLDMVRLSLPESLRVEIEIEPLIVKQDWGKLTAENRPIIEADRYRTGVLRYTFPTGESAESLIGRLTTFRDKLYRLQEESGDDIVVLSHGFEFRVLLMLILGWNEEEFESFGNLSNCEFRILTMENPGEYGLDRPLAKHGLPITRLQHLRY